MLLPILAASHFLSSRSHLWFSVLVLSNNQWCKESPRTVGRIEKSTLGLPWIRCAGECRTSLCFILFLLRLPLKRSWPEASLLLPQTPLISQAAVLSFTPSNLWNQLRLMLTEWCSSSHQRLHGVMSHSEFKKQRERHTMDWIKDVVWCCMMTQTDISAAPWPLSFIFKGCHWFYLLTGSWPAGSLWVLTDTTWSGHIHIWITPNWSECERTN